MGGVVRVIFFLSYSLLNFSLVVYRIPVPVCNMPVFQVRGPEQPGQAGERKALRRSHRQAHQEKEGKYSFVTVLFFFL
jgi:hypothetical protein